MTTTMHLRERPGTKPQRTVYEIQGASRVRADKVPRYLLSEAAQSRLTLCDPRDYSLLGSSVHGIFQARVPEWGAIATY